MNSRPSLALSWFGEVAARARATDVFADVQVGEVKVECAAKDCPEPAFYRLALEDGTLWVSFVTPARYLSQSIEADLVHTGDKMHELISDELVDQGYAGKCGTVEHFRSVDKLYTFRTVVPVDPQAAASDATITTALQWLLALEAAFRPLGDVSAAGDED